MLLPKGLHEQIVRIVSGVADVEKVILFGSRACGDANDRSDVDLAIVCPNANQKQWIELAFALEEIDTLLKLDVVRLEEASMPLQNKIQEEGVVLYERT
ncbi:type VII toxin-antitoxin system MntA family adenylyltransferase antitoxin [Aneurinibacillus terranovensis]|uniref:type VII toxin-antitoxin system MntA family adenylyltransferase antitoxin n=1 Tax=Aneurinibacillus terranovensis TaxID=278991 RepID=UPI000413246A|nr:nucleotidyltransferase domain-containing protein [Aneurinibacillus terranovensis]